MPSIKLQSDPIRKKTTTMHIDRGAEGYVLESKQDVTDIIERNKARMALVDENAGWNEWAQVAEIPVEVWYNHLVPSGIANDETRLRKWLDDRDNLLFRTRPGRMSK